MRYTAVLRLMIMFFCHQATFCVCSGDAYQKAASAAGVKSIKVKSLVSYWYIDLATAKSKAPIYAF